MRFVVSLTEAKIHSLWDLCLDQNEDNTKLIEKWVFEVFGGTIISTKKNLVEIESSFYTLFPQILAMSKNDDMSLGDIKVRKVEIPSFDLTFNDRLSCKNTLISLALSSCEEYYVDKVHSVSFEEVEELIEQLKSDPRFQCAFGENILEFKCPEYGLNFDYFLDESELNVSFINKETGFPEIRFVVVQPREVKSVAENWIQLFKDIAKIQ